MTSGDGGPPKINLSAGFKAVLLCVMALTLISLAVSVGLAVKYDSPTEHVTRLIEMSSTMYRIAFGAIVGLIGGKSL